MNETKNVDKICPFFGSHRITSTDIGSKIIKGSTIQFGYDLLNCQKEKCQLWAYVSNACCIELISLYLDDLFTFAATIEGCLDNIEAAIRDLKKESHENS